MESEKKIPRFSISIDTSRLALKFAKEYFVTTLLQPWIWVFGYVIVTGVFIGFVFYRDPELVLSGSARLPEGFNFFLVWFYSLVVIVFNYTFSFIFRYKTPKLSLIFFLLSLNVLLILLIAIFPLLINQFS